MFKRDTSGSLEGNHPLEYQQPDVWFPLFRLTPSVSPRATYCYCWVKVEAAIPPWFHRLCTSRFGFVILSRPTGSSGLLFGWYLKANQKHTRHVGHHFLFWEAPISLDVLRVVALFLSDLSSFQTVCSMNMCGLLFTLPSLTHLARLPFCFPVPLLLAEIVLPEVGSMCPRNLVLMLDIWVQTEQVSMCALCSRILGQIPFLCSLRVQAPEFWGEFTLFECVV